MVSSFKLHRQGPPEIQLLPFRYWSHAYGTISRTFQNFGGCLSENPGAKRSPPLRQRATICCSMCILTMTQDMVWQMPAFQELIPYRGGDMFAWGQFRRGIISEGENFATSRNPEPAVISWWAVDGSKHIFEPSLHLVHCCTFLNSVLHLNLQ